MEVTLSPEVQAKLDHIAAEQGRDTEALVREALERLVNYDKWFLGQVEQGLAAAERGEFVEHEDVATLLDRRYPA